MKHSVTPNPNEKGGILLLGTLSMLFIVPMMGLSVDVGFLYAVKSKLQASVDGAALASARALNIGSTLAAQEASATANATTWFNANFPAGYFGTYNTTIATPTYNSSNQVMSIAVTAQTKVDSFFMKWLGFGATTINATGTATRRTVVAMIVLDRSGSMCVSGGVQNAPCAGTGNSYPCSAMVSAAKVFTGQFAEGSDYIGLISFSDNAYIHSVPVTNFQSVLGYSNASGSGTGALDTISCDGGTGTAEGVSLAYQALSQAALPGALNVIMLETDGLPNTLTMNFWDSTNNVPGLTANSGCTDGETSPKTYANGGFASASQVPKWTYGLALNGSAGQTNGFGITSGSYVSPNATSSGYYANIPAGMVYAVASSDPSSGNYFFFPINYWTKILANSNAPGQTTSNNYNSTGYLSDNGCEAGGADTTPNDIGWFPTTDVFGNTLVNASYQAVTTSGGHVTQSGSSPSNWTNFHAAVLNATDNAAYVVRSNASLPATVFAIGLGGNSTNGPPDPVLLQRMANDPNGDEFNTTGPDAGGAYYTACSTETACTTYSSQPQGTFIYAPNSTYLATAFLRISSQVLRLSK